MLVGGPPLDYRRRWVETYEFLCDHAAHGDSDDVHAPWLGPADVVEELYEVFGHFGGGVPEEWFAAFAHASVVKDERSVLAAFGVAEVFELSLPCFHETAKSHDPL